MCLAAPGKILAINDRKATVDMLGVRIDADISLVDDVGVGDYILVHAGFGMQKVEPEDAAAILKQIEELARLASDSAQ